MASRITFFLVDLHGDLRVIQDRLQTILKECHMALDPQVEQKLTELSTAIADEILDVRNLIQAGTDPTELIDRLDSVIKSVRAISDDAQTPPAPPGG